jgi:putative endonuclease
MRNKSEIGRMGEDIAYEYLRKSKYRVLERNYREKYDEIDIIAKAKDKTLIFVEVKTMQGPLDSSFDLVPEDQLTGNKFHKISRLCSVFAGKHPNLIDDKEGWRIDLVAITLGESEDDFKIKHYQNIR